MNKQTNRQIRNLLAILALLVLLIYAVTYSPIAYHWGYAKGIAYGARGKRELPALPWYSPAYCQGWREGYRTGFVDMRPLQIKRRQ